MDVVSWLTDPICHCSTWSVAVRTFNAVLGGVAVVWLTYFINWTLGNEWKVHKGHTYTLVGLLMMLATTTTAQLRNLALHSPLNYITYMTMVSTIAVIFGCWVTTREMRSAK